MTNEKINISALLKEQVRKNPDKKAIIYSAGFDDNGKKIYKHITFEQLDKDSDCYAYGLEENGITRGTKTIIMVKPGRDTIVLLYALLKIGAVPVVVDPGMGLGRMLHCFQSTKPDAFIGISIAHMLRVLRPKFFKTLKVWVTVGKKYFWGGPNMNDIYKTPWKEFQPFIAEEDDLAAIFFTTGSTGPAKGVEYTYGMMDTIINILKTGLGMDENDIDLATYSLFGLIDPMIGVTVVIPDMDASKPAEVDPETIIGNIKDNSVTNMFASPALLNPVGRYGQSKGIKLPTLKRTFSGGAPVRINILERFISLLNDNVQLFKSYGATEVIPISMVGSNEVLSETKERSELGYGTCVGRPFKGVEVQIIKITDDPIENWSEDLVVPQGEIGELVLKGGHVSKSYFERPEANEIAKIKDGDTIRHRMGDVGRFDEKGRIWYCGRKNHRVVTKKGLLFSVPCELILNQHPDVYRSALVGVGSKPNEKPVICIELEKESSSKNKLEILREISEMAKKNDITKDIETYMFHKSFPVDIRHNAKISREILALWAEKKISSK
ncbi:MAG: AMP-binding protein [archaeon]|nr:AMP-binding protein [archaeon]